MRKKREELAHAVMEVGRSETGQAGQWAGNSDRVEVTFLRQNFFSWKPQLLL